MSNLKSIIEIDVQDEKFNAFYERFGIYSNKLEDMPDDWKVIAKEILGAGEALEGFDIISASAKESLMIAAIQADAIGKNVAKAINAQKEFATAAHQGKSQLADMAKHAKTLSSEVFGIGKFLMKMSAIGITGAALGSVFSGFGLERLAKSSLNMQGDARKIGVTQGQLSSWQTAYGRYVDSSILNDVANTQSDLGKIGNLTWALRKSAPQVQKESPIELSQELIQTAHDWWTKTPESMRDAQRMSQTGLHKFFSFDQVRSFGEASQSELNDAAATYSKNIKNFDVSDKTNDAWYKFVQQIETAGKSIEADLTRKLGILAPDLTHFIDVLSNDAQILINEVLTPKNLHDLGDALNDLTTYLGSDQFKQDVKDFGKNVSELAGDAANFLRFMDNLIHPGKLLGFDDDKEKVVLDALWNTTPFGLSAQYDLAAYNYLFGKGDDPTSKALDKSLSSDVSGLMISSGVVPDDYIDQNSRRFKDGAQDAKPANNSATMKIDTDYVRDPNSGKMVVSTTEKANLAAAKILIDEKNKQDTKTNAVLKDLSKRTDADAAKIINDTQKPKTETPTEKDFVSKLLDKRTDADAAKIINDTQKPKTETPTEKDFVSKLLDKRTDADAANRIDFTQYLGSDAIKKYAEIFGERITSFSKELGHASDALRKFANSIYGMASFTDSAKSNADRARENSIFKTPDMTPEERAFSKTVANQSDIDAKKVLVNNVYDPKAAEQALASAYANPDEKVTFDHSLSDKERHLAGLEKAKGLPRGLLDAIMYVESGRSTNEAIHTGDPASSAMGNFQFLKNTGVALGVKNRGDFYDEAQGAAEYYRRELQKYKGDIAKAVAAYGWGEGSVDAAVKRYGDNWRQGISSPHNGDFQKYLERLITVMTKNQQAIKVEVANSTSARVAVSANAARAGL